MERGTLRVRAWAIQASATLGWFPWHGLSVSGDEPDEGCVPWRSVQRSAHHSIVHHAAGNSPGAGHRGDRLWDCAGSTPVAGRGRGEGSDQSVVPQAPQPKPARIGNGNGAGITIPLRQPVAGAAGQPCWSLKGCSEFDASQLRSIPSTQCTLSVRAMNAEGRLPEGCKDCKVYQPTVTVWTEQGLILH